MSSISTHVLDTSLGRPAAGVPVMLERKLGETWTEISSHCTDADGRVTQLAAAPLEVGTYRISFATAVYFAAQTAAGLYPLVEITILVREPAAHYHIPLLLTANGYSTYRGS